jgi:ketopantoate reductase
MPMSEKRIFLIGPGEVGRRLGGALQRSGWRVEAIGRGGDWSAAGDPTDPAPRLVAVREEDLGAVLARLTGPLRSRVVLVQNGFLEAVHGDLGAVSRGLVWFMSKGDVFHELTTSLFYGPLADELVPPLSEGGLDVARVEDGAPALREMILKGIWNCLVGLPLAVSGLELDAYRRERQAELMEMIREGCATTGAEYGVKVTPDEALACIDSTIGPIGWVKGGMKALAWRNGAIALFGRRHGISTPLTDSMLASAGYRIGPS